MRKLESRIFERQKAIARQWSLPMTGVRLTQFFGIELTDFAAETAKLSLWIAEYQMNEQFKVQFGSAPPALPLGGILAIVPTLLRGNAAVVPLLRHGTQSVHRNVPTETVGTMQHGGNIKILSAARVFFMTGFRPSPE